MHLRDEQLPEDLVDHLCKTVPGFRQEALQHQIGLARMLWVGDRWYRQHKHFEGAMFFSYIELQGSFGRQGFDAINERLGFFRVTNQWFKDDKLTRGYWFTDPIKEIRDKYFRGQYKKETRLIIGSGITRRFMKTPPRAIAAKDKNKQTTNAWDHLKQNNVIEVNLPRLQALHKWLDIKRKDAQRGQVNGTLLSPLPPAWVINRLHNMTAQIIRSSMTEPAGRGKLMHRYEEATSGRLFAQGVNLQNAPELIKQAALAGHMDYDFSNCHYAILRQMAARFGYECQAIDHYLDHKELVRRQIADQAQIQEHQAKSCLLMLLYGASQSEEPGRAIPKEIGIEAARRLYQVDLFAGIHNDIDKARAVILKGWDRRQRGGLVNEFGKTLKTKDASKPQLLAHLLQGVEALTLRIATLLHAQHIALVQHDGFVTTKSLTNRQILEIEDAIVDATGYRLKLVRKQIQIDTDAYFLKNSYQNGSALPANTGAGFSHMLAS